MKVLCKIKSVLIHILIFIISAVTYSTGQCDDVLNMSSSYGKQGNSKGRLYDIQEKAKTLEFHKFGSELTSKSA